MNGSFDIQEYMTKGVERIVADAIKATLKDPKESAFMLKFASASKKASSKRKKAEENGEHIPPFLIASITSKCNLHCAGCYSRCNHATVDSEPVSQLTDEEWFKIFDEAVAGHSAKALKMCAEIETTDDPYMTLGAFASSAYKKLELKQRKAPDMVRILAKADIDMKRTGIDGWKIIKKALLEIAALA